MRQPTKTVITNETVPQNNIPIPNPMHLMIGTVLMLPVVQKRPPSIGNG